MELEKYNDILNYIEKHPNKRCFGEGDEEYKARSFMRWEKILEFWRSCDYEIPEESSKEYWKILELYVAQQILYCPKCREKTNNLQLKEKCPGCGYAM